MKRRYALILSVFLLMMGCGHAAGERVRIAEEAQMPALPESCAVYSAKIFYLAALPASLFGEEGSLWVRDSLNLAWSGPDAANYHQLLQYIHDHDLPLGGGSLAFMTAEDASALCQEWLEGAGLGNLTLAAAYTLPQEQLEAYTDAMKKEYAGMKAPSFAKITAEKEAYCLIFRSAFDGRMTVGDGTPFPAEDGAQGMFILRADGLAYIELDQVLGSVTVKDANAAAMSFDEAFRIFCESREDYLAAEEEYTVTNVSFGYQAPNVSLQDLQAEFVPFWQIDYLRTLTFEGTQVTTRHETLINALTGKTWQTR